MIQKCETRREWRGARQGGIGASEWAPILGQDQRGFASPVSICKEKIDPLPDEPDEQPRRGKPTDAEVGLYLEPGIAEMFRDFCDDEDLPANWSVHDPGDFTIYWAEKKMVWHTKGSEEDARAIRDAPDHRCVPVKSRDAVGVIQLRDIFFCTPDRILLDGDGKPFALLEVKTAKQKQARRFQREFPVEHQIQTQAQMHCTGLNLVYFAVLLWGDDFRWFKQERDQRFIDAALPKLRRFWESYVLTKTLPPTDFSPATTQALSAHYHEPEDNELQLGDEFDGVEADLTRWEAKAAEADRKVTGLKNQVRGALGNATAGVAPDGSYFTWRPDKRGRRTFRHKGGKADE